MSRRLKVNFKTIRTGCRRISYSTQGHFNENIAYITNVPYEILKELHNTSDVIVDRSKKTIALLRNAQVMVRLRDKQYAYDVLLTFCAGRLMVTSICVL
jgi:hypothetical protein